MPYNEQLAARVRKVLSGHRGVVERQMIGGLSFMVDSLMCCRVSARSGLMIRVGPEQIDAMLKRPHVLPAMMGKKQMAGFVRIDPAGYRTDAALAKWVQAGLDYIATLPAAKEKKIVKAK